MSKLTDLHRARENKLLMRKVFTFQYPFVMIKTVLERRGSCYEKI